MGTRLVRDWAQIATMLERFRRAGGVAIAVAMLLGVYVLVRATGGTPNPLVHLDYFAIIVAAIAAGPLGGVAAGIAAGLMLGPLMPDSTATSATTLAHLGWLIRLAVYAIAGVLIAAAWRWASRVGRIEATRAEARRVLDAASAEPTSQAACRRLLSELGGWRSSLAAALYVLESSDRVELLASWTAPGVELPGSWRDGGDPSGTTPDARGLPRRRPLAPAAATALASHGGRCETIVPLELEGTSVGFIRLAGNHDPDPLDHDALHGLLEIAQGAAALVRRARLDERSATRRAIELVHGVLDRPEVLRPVFQPILSVGGGGVAGYEALARFDVEPSEPPDRWFARAAEAGRAAELQALAIRRARDVAAAAHLPTGSFLTLNVSPGLLGSDLVRAALAGPLDDVVIELTEEEAIADYEALRLTMVEYRARGARFAVDDAGAGYASMRHVTELRPDYIKLDARLVIGLSGDDGRQALIRAMQTFAADVGAVLIAEGVETPDELRLLAATGRPILAQGYAIARPGAPWPAVDPSVRPILDTAERSSPAGYPTAIGTRVTTSPAPSG